MGGVPPRLTEWEAWLARTGVRPDDATGEHVAAWCEHLADEHKASTVARKVSSLGALYRFMGRRSPTRTDVVRTTLAGIRRAKGTARKQARPLTADLVGNCRQTPTRHALWRFESGQMSILLCNQHAAELASHERLTMAA